MQETRKTAGETAKPTNPYEGELLAIKAELGQKVGKINEKIDAVQCENHQLKHKIRENNQVLKNLHEQKDHIRLHYKRFMAAVYDLSQEWYFDPARNSICRRLGVFFEMHPDMREQWKQDQEAIRKRILEKNEIEASFREGGEL